MKNFIFLLSWKKWLVVHTLLWNICSYFWMDLSLMVHCGPTQGPIKKWTKDWKLFITCSRFGIVVIAFEIRCWPTSWSCLLTFKGGVSYSILSLVRGVIGVSHTRAHSLYEAPIATILVQLACGKRCTLRTSWTRIWSMGVSSGEWALGTAIKCMQICKVLLPFLQRSFAYPLKASKSH